jgi:hypothetical protein
MAANDMVIVTPLPEGDHDVSLTDVSANCSVDDDNPRRVTVLPNDTVPVRFTVTCRAEFLSALILSNPVPARGVAEPVVYASVRPGSFLSEADRVLIRTRRTGIGVIAWMRDRGFDPVPVAAVAGDTLDVQEGAAGGSAGSFYFAVVPARRAPVVVRSDPTVGADRVPLDVAPLIVFSEPIGAGTAAGLVMDVHPSGASVAGAVAFGDSAHLTATFTPAELLAENAQHSVRLTQAITDLDGDSLETPLSISFWTHNPEYWDDAPPPALVAAAPVGAPGAAYLPLQPRRSDGGPVAMRDRRTGPDGRRGGRRFRSAPGRGAGR